MSRAMQALTSWRSDAVVWAEAALALHDEAHTGSLGRAARNAQFLIQHPGAGTLRSSTCSSCIPWDVIRWQVRRRVLWPSITQ